MIINIRGTHGSGKSTAVRALMAECINRTPNYIPGRRQPFGYRMNHLSSDKKLWVPGHYEGPCGGCDTITDTEDIFESIRSHALDGEDVIYEGILAQHANPRTIAMHLDGLDLRVYVIEILDLQAVEEVRKRREAKAERFGKVAKQLNPENILKECKAVRSGAKALKASNVPVTFTTRENIVPLVMYALGWVNSYEIEVAN